MDQQHGAGRPWMPGNELVIESCKNRNREHQKDKKRKKKDNAKQGKYRVKNSNLILKISFTPAPFFLFILDKWRASRYNKSVALRNDNIL